jgi:phage recombination protein Bet
MSNNVATIPRTGNAMTAADHQDAIRTALKSSLYPGASDASVDLVLSYCQASGLDPMTKPVHIVPMKVNTGKKDQYGNDIKETRDVVMPGIGLYRINAARTSEYAGCSEPEYGPTQLLHYKRDRWEDGPNNKRVKKLVDAEMPYPEWCRVTVTRIVDGKERLFTAKEYWLENYAEKGDTGGPNSMWEKRPFAQLAKCTEAQALRKAFPEAVGSQPTADEMEGKDVIDSMATVVQQPARAAIAAEKPAYPAEELAKNLPTWRGLIESGKKDAEALITMLQSKATFTAEQLKEIRAPFKPDPADDEAPLDDQEAQA